MTRKKTGFNKAAYDKEYIKNNVVRIPFDAPKKSGLKERIEAGAKLHGISKNAYITNAVNEQLKIDGIPEVEPNDSDQEES